MTLTVEMGGQPVEVTYDPQDPLSIVIDGVLFERIGGDIYVDGELAATITAEPGIEPYTSWIYTNTCPYDENDYNERMGEEVYNLKFRERILNNTIKDLVGLVFIGLGFEVEKKVLSAVLDGLGVICSNILDEARIDLRFGNQDIVYAKEILYDHDFIPYTRRNEFTFFKDRDLTEEVEDTAMTMYSMWA